MDTLFSEFYRKYKEIQSEKTLVKNRINTIACEVYGQILGIETGFSDEGEKFEIRLTINKRQNKPCKMLKFLCKIGVDKCWIDYENYKCNHDYVTATIHVESTIEE